MLVDPFAIIPDADGRVGWSPLDDSTDYARARAIAQAMTRSQAGLSQRVWEVNGADVLAALLWAAAVDPALGLRDVLRWAKTRQTDPAADVLRAHAARTGDAAAIDVLDTLEGIAGLEGKLANSAWLSARTALSAFDNPQVLATAEAPVRFRPAMLRDGKPARSTSSGRRWTRRR